MLDRWLKRVVRRGYCRLTLSRNALTVGRVGASRKAPGLLVERSIPAGADASSETLAAWIAAALDESGSNGLPVHVTFADELVRYFIVTPADNSVRIQDLRAAAGVRFLTLFGEDPADWQFVADWKAAEPFLACAVSRHWLDGMQQAVSAGRGCVVSAVPEFVAAWNRSCRDLGGDTWLATCDEHSLTLGLVTVDPRPRIAAVRTVALPDPVPSIAWLRARVSRTALLDNLSPPSTLLLHGRRCDAWLQGAIDSSDAAMTVRWVEPADRATPGANNAVVEPATSLAWSGTTQ
ncbi:hypothetical protein [Burkholderia sp. Ac-20365]|uniref:hypothetical protein n=1 Tax=Burkholderia sp. Ac-20365 TaxID=2703897 RepID=UPI00197CA606|nr:hypothetical protein [Burkholderia sp. Ac-20365]MBN3759280.1 hypothetical protein [Burkholderia sp. Ac-20365]